MASRQEAGVEPAARRKAALKQSGIKVTKTIRKPREPAKHTPSAYLAEMRMDTEERLATVTEMYPPTITELLDITTSSYQKDFFVGVDQALFQPFPSEVVFQQFQSQQTHQFPLNFRNNDQVARHLKVDHEDSPYFRVVCQRPAGSKVAPGMEVTYLILFTPDEKKDYHLELVCTTERERFVVPVRAVGVRALLDFPDDINFPASPVKYPSSKTILVRSVGDQEAQFALHTKSPYSVDPTSATLKEGHCMQVTVTFKPASVGDFSGELTVRYGTGESVYSSLHGSSVDVNVRLDRSSLKLENTYIGLSTQRSVTLYNRSEVVVHYQWKAFSSIEEEEAQKQLHLTELEEEEAMAQEILLERSLHDPTMRDRMTIVAHSLANKRKRFVDMEKFLFCDDNISIDPVEGEIWPNSQAEISVIFNPSESTSYSRVVYCDVTGRESRLPLRLAGQGIGPCLMFSFDTLDIQNVFINSAHAYEVILENKGDIDAGYKLKSPNSLFGPFFTFSPSSGVLQPGALQAIQISFCSTILGEFSEDFEWAVRGSPTPLSLRITGVVIGPTFQFDPTHIKFGTVSYGFLSSREVVLTNTSEIPMTYRLRVSSNELEDEMEEGEGEGETEFVVESKSGVLPPNCHQAIQINFVPAAVKVYSTELVLFVAEAGEEIFSLPISAKSEVPAVRLETPYLDYGRCFLQYPYTLGVVLTNPSRLPVKYEMEPPPDERTLHYTTDPSSGVIDAGRTLELPLQIEPRVVGEVITAAVFRILGSLEDPLEVAVRFVGEGPVISASSTELHWGRQPVLTPLPKTVYLTNESLIPAEYECVLTRDGTVFSMNPPSGVIAPQKTLKLIVTATIDDSLRFTDKVTVIVSKGVNITISLSAEGEGTTIVSQPPLQPKVDLGPHFCNSWPCRRQFTLMNRGRRLQALSWTTQGFSTAKLKKMEIKRATQDLKDVGRKRPQREAELKRPVFRIIPDKFLLEPFETCTVTLEGSSQEPKSVAERLMCHAIIGKNAHKERIMTVDILANFISPLTQFSTREISFTLYQPPGSELVQQKQSLSLQNVSPLPFTAVLMCIYPFSFQNVAGKLQQLELELESSQEKEVVVQFDPTYCRDRVSQAEDNQLVVAYREHPLREYLSLNAKVFFPNLEFETTDVDFGCILNDTETIRYVKMTNTGPLEVKYKWYFPRRPPVHRQDPEQCDEGVDMQSECETDSLTEEETEEEGESEEGEEGESEEEGEEIEQTASSVAEGEEGESGLLENDPENTEDVEGLSGSESKVSQPRDGNSVAEGDKHLVSPSEEPPTSPVTQEGATASVVIPNAAAVLTENSQQLPESGLVEAGRKEKQPWELVDDPFKLVRIEQIFDILPLHGTLLPGESQQVQFTFYGYRDIATECLAACVVDGGPTYHVRLSGEASNVQYKFNHSLIDFGEQLYGQVLTSEVVLYNTGKVDMDFTALGLSSESHLAPGEVSVQPSTGLIQALDSMTLTVSFLHGVPGKFQKALQIQVAHLQPDEITLVGEGVFPRVGFDLPSQLLDSEYDQLRETARKMLTLTEPPQTASDKLPDVLLLEMERLLVKQFILNNSGEIHSPHGKKGKLRPSLPPYQLDFGYVVYGSVETRRVALTNTGSCPVSFNTSLKTLEGTGFSLDLVSKVRALPGAPEPESLEFNVQFDPAAVQCPLGHTNTVLPFNVFNGPVYSIVLSATVTKPALQLSTEEIDFETVACGQCKIATVRISNPFHVSCCWSAVTNKPPKKIPKHVPMHVRRKIKDKPPPTFFEVDPPSGVLQPGHSSDIRIRFMPTEELEYEDIVPFHISHNPDSDTVLAVKGQGSEPCVEFDRQLVQFPAVLPFADGSEAEVLVSNPQPYPVEIYSLEFDKQYLEEEEILRWVKGYDGQKRLFLPPIVPGEKLPREILQAWEKETPQPTEPLSKDDLQSTVEGSRAEMEQGSELKLPPSSTNLLQQGLLEGGRSLDVSTTALLSVPEIGLIESVTGLTTEEIECFSQTNMDGMDAPPVAAAVARYMGIDLSPEGARNELRKGIAFIVDGPPLSGRTTLARVLAEKYKAAVINVDKLLKELTSKAETPEGRRMRQLCIDAEIERQAQEEVGSVVTAPTTGKRTSTKDIKDKDGKDHAAKEEVQQPVASFTVLPLPDTDLAVPESSLLPVPLPKEIICQILENRVQQSDCRHGVVFDGVDSVFTSCPSSAFRIILEVIHNRKHMYVAKIEMELGEIKERKLRLEKEAEMRAKEEQRLREEKEREEVERVQREMEIDEEEYEALSEEDRAKFDQKLLAVKKEKNRIKQKEKDEKERLEHEREEEEKRIAEETKKKKGKGRKVPTAAALASPSRPMSGMRLHRDSLGMVSQASFASGVGTPGKGKAAKSPGVTEDHAVADPLDKQFEYHSHHSGKVSTLLADWDRVARVDRPAPQEEPVEPSLAPTKKSNRKPSAANIKPLSPTSAAQATTAPLPEVNRDELGVPLITLSGSKPTEELVEDFLSQNEIPTPDEILEILGLGAGGPPIAKPVTFQVYPYPLKRMKLADQDHFTFIATSPDDPNAEKVKPPPPEVPPEPVADPPPSQSRKRSESRQSPLKQSRKKGSSKAASPLPGVIVEEEEKAKEEKKPSKPAKLTSYRWVVPAHGQRKIKLVFSSREGGQFDHTFNLEVAGTRQRYQLFCRGQCHVPSICQDPRTIFTQCKKYARENEIVHKQYVLSENVYMFGPLQASKSRERYKKGLQPENMEKVIISNPGRIQSEVSFFFREDANGTTYILDPPTMTLEAGESQTLTVWAFPEKCNVYNDALVCCIKHNPNPVVIPITCTGVVPEIRFDQKQLDFKKVLLHRKQTNVLTLTNPTLIPVAWKLGGLEQLGDEFSFNQEQGVVPPLTSFPLQVSFRAAKPVTIAKKAIKVEVSDVERKHMGLVQIENITINAEAYDVAMDISFPKGADGGLDFPCVFAGSDHKLLMQLKNKGKYDIGFAFSFTKASNGKSYSDMFKVSPSHSALYATEKAMSVSVVFHSTTEVAIKEETILKCEVIDRHVGDQGDVIACIPIKVSAKAVFSKFGLSPPTGINFGAMTVNTKKQCTFVLENCGEFDFKYAIVAADGSQKKQAARPGRASSRARDGQESFQTSSLLKVEGGRGGGKSKTEVASIRTEVVSTTQRLVLGIFTIQPATGTIPAGQSTEIKVDCTADRPGKQAIALLIEVSDRSIHNPPILYHIHGDVLEPAINTADLGAIFEEHGVCQSLGVMGPQLFHRKGCVGVYGETERRFAFKSVIVGQTAKARFKVINSTKIPCDAKLAIGSTSSKQKGVVEGFEVDPKSTFTIPSHSHVFATVTFQPTAIQTYSAVFEAYPEDYKQKALTFELHGDGNLPQVEVTHPTLRNAKGQSLLVYRRLLTDQSQSLCVSLRNVGTIPAVVQVRIRSGKQHYRLAILQDTATAEEVSENSGKSDSRCQRKDSASLPLSLSLNVGETRSFPVKFQPRVAEKCHGELSLRVQDNQFETLSIQLVGEGYQDDVSIQNIHGGADREGFSRGADTKAIVPEEVEAGHENSLDFGDFAVGESRQITFSLSNHGSEPVKFQWPTSLPGLSFSPSTGHLHPSSSKDISVTFRSDKVVSLRQERVPGKIWRIKFRDPLDKVCDWDDRHKTVRWVNVPRSATEGTSLTDKPLPSPAKQKVVEVEAEPQNTAVDDSRRELTLSVWATVDYARYTCPCQEIRFTDTLLYQTRVYKLPLSNTGQIDLSYSWSVVHVDGSPATPHSSQLELDQTTGTVAGEGGEVVPFSISQTSGQILPGRDTVFSVSFSPLDVREWEYTLVCSISNLESSSGPLEVVVSGKALMPHCHFELEPSNYPVTQQQTGGGKRDLQAIEFHSSGIGIKSVKRFEVINPTFYGYEFNWTYEGRQTSSLQPSVFKCLTPKGFIEAGKTYEMAFEFTPSCKETAESLWRFSIPALSQSFLLVGHTTEPAVLLDRAYVNFHSIKLGSTRRETVYLVNNEPTAQSFEFLKKSCYSSGHSARVKVNPLQGTVGPYTRIPIEFSFTASLPQEFSFNLECRVKHKPTPLRLNVKARGYEVKMGLSFTNTSGDSVDVPIHSETNSDINFGKVPISERALGKVTIMNYGDYNLQYQWILSEECTATGAQGCQLVSIDRAEGSVEAQDRTNCELVFAPPRKMTLKNCTLTLKVVNGPTIPICVLGSGVEPKLVFSPKEVDFGMCFLHQAEMSPKQTKVVVTNREKDDMSIKCLFENKLHFEVHSEQCLLKSGESSEMVVVFRPTQATRYEDKIEFEVNGLSKTSITVKGEGVPMKVELANPAQRVLNLGALRVSESVKREVTIVNRSAIPLTLSVSLVTTSHQLQEDSSVLTVDTVDSKTLLPKNEITLKARNGAGKVLVSFTPTVRIAHFQEEVILESSGMSQPLFMVTGSCLGQEIQLDMEHIPFGTVCQGSQTSRHILIINSGDIGASFKWESAKFAPDFSISPTEGYLSPGMEVPLDVTFHPQRVGRDIRYERLPCEIEGSSPLFLTLSGICTEQKPEKEIQQFTTAVRTAKTKSLPPIRNDSNSTWRLTPVIGGQYWTGPDSITITANSTGTYELTYNPLAMTSDTDKHHGSVFFPFPNGNGLLYTLQGTAEPPDVTAHVSREIPCKTPHTELLTVPNWLRRPQRFRVIRELLRPDKLDQSLSLHGMDYIDVPALGKRDYQLNFYSFKECTILAKVTFMIEQTGEYMFYNVSFKSTPSGIMDTIELSTQVRRSVSHDIVITNPLNSQVTFSASTTVPEISLPSNFVVGPDSKISRTFEYLPLRAGETVGKLTFSSSELGVYQYELQLTATPPTPEIPTHFTCHLGKSKQLQCKVPNYAKGPRVEYSCKVRDGGEGLESSDFHVEKSIMASGAEVVVEVTFEPCHLGDSQATLYLSSSQGGDYTIPLLGHCLPPQPEGPHVVKAGQTITIPFKNVFPQTVQFSYSVNSPVFSVKATDTLKPRKTCNMQVTYDAKQADPHHSKMGKLVVTSQQSARSAASRGHTPPPTSWVYYLKGIPS